MRRTSLPVLLVALALPLAGCIQNMADLKDRVDPASTEVPALVEQAAAPAAANLTPPVARVTVFGASNALLYKAPFQGADEASPILVPAGVELTLIGTDSEAVAAGAKVAAYAWTVQGKTTTGPKASTTLPGPGTYPLVLNVTDSNGLSDEQRLTLGVMPEPFDVVTNLTTGQLAGAQGHGEAATLPFALDAAAAGKPATVQAVTVVASPPLACDVELDVQDAAGESLGKANGGSLDALDQEETVDLGALPSGAYAIVVTPLACVEPEGVPVQVTVTFLEIVPGLTDGSGDGHGGHAH